VLYRDVKIRSSALITNQLLDPLPQEEIFATVRPAAAVPTQALRLASACPPPSVCVSFSSISFFVFVSSQQLDGIWNLSGEKGELGHFIITNIRVVWFSAMEERFNVSCPYNAIVRKRPGRAGPGQGRFLPGLTRPGAGSGCYPALQVWASPCPAALQAGGELELGLSLRSPRTGACAVHVGACAVYVRR
jgi:hypothetical protein